MQTFDLIVIGSGGGTKLIRPVASLGKKVAIIEMGSLGGTCLNRGCIPSKRLIYHAHLAQLYERLKDFHLTSKGKLKSDFPSIVKEVNFDIQKQSTSIVKLYQKTNNVTLFRHKAHFIKPYVLQAGKEQITAKHIVLGVGARPTTLPIKGIDQIEVLTSTEALQSPKQPKSLLIIGGGYIAVELGFFFAALGTQVTLVVRSKVLKREDEEIRKRFCQEFQNLVTLHEGCQPIEVKKQKEGIVLICKKSSKQMTLKAEKLLIAAGVTPWSDQLALENTQVQTDLEGFIRVNRFLETNQKGVYALGDCIRPYQFRHSVNFQGAYLFSHLFENYRKPIYYPPMPHAVFSSPEIASCGPTEQILQEKKIPYVVGRGLYEESAKGRAMKEQGIVKLLFHQKTKKLLSFHIVGYEAATLAHQLIFALTVHAKLDELLSMIYIHPALSEVIRNACRSAKEHI